MKHRRHPQNVLMFCLVVTFLSLFSCNALQTSLNKVDLSPMIRKLKNPGDSLARTLAGNAIMGVADSSHKALDTVFLNLNGHVDPELAKLVHALNTFGDTTNFQISKIGDNLHWQIGKLKGDIKTSGPMLDKMVEQLKGKVTNITGSLVANALDTLSSARSKAKIDSVIANLLDNNTKTHLSNVVSGAMQPTLDSLSKDVNQLVHKDVPFMTKQAVILVVCIGVVVAIIIALVWFERRKYIRLSEVLTSEINKMPADKVGAYDDLTHRIQSRAQDENLEPLLRKLLVKQGIN